MKILCLSDLHLQTDTDPIIDQIKSISEEFDMVVISGDIIEYDYKGVEIHKFLHHLFHGKPVVCCLGNHELFCSSWEEVLKAYKRNYSPDEYNVHYLDTIESFIIDDIEFIGGFLGYDGSLKDNESQDITKWADYCWADKYIKNWDKDYKKAYNHYYNKISESCCKSKAKTKILVTHTVPHRELNEHRYTKSLFNAYSGTENILKDFDFKYSISGHLHKRTIGKKLENCFCVNTGSEYSDLKYFILEV